MASAGLESGIVVPHGDYRDPPPDVIRMVGALFADDAVGLSPSLEAVCAFCTHVTAWCDLHEMRVGIRKCGIMEFPEPGRDEGTPGLSEDHPLRPQMLLQEQLVPIVTEYKYLGIILTPNLCRRKIVDHRGRIASITIAKLAAFLRTPTLPVPMRLSVLRAVVLPRLLYGSEIYGMTRRFTDKTQVVFNRAMRALLGLRTLHPKYCPSAPMWCELGLAPICALAAGRKMRAYRKCFSLKTQVQKLVSSPLKTRSWTWASGADRWFQRHCIPLIERAEHQFPTELRPWRGKTDWTPTSLNPKLMQLLVESTIKYRENVAIRVHGHLRDGSERFTAAKTAAYFRRMFWYHRLSKARVFCHPAETAGVAAVMVYRIGAVMLGPDYVEADRINKIYKNWCPFCQREGPETFYHLFFECRAFRKARRESGLLGTIEKVDELLTEHHEKTAPEDLERFDRLGMSRLSDSELRLSWLLGGRFDKKWVLQNFVPPPPLEDMVIGLPHNFSTEADAQSLPSSLDTVSTSHLGAISSIASGGTPNTVESDNGSLPGEGVPHLFHVGRYLARVRQSRGRTLSRLIRHHQSHPDLVMANPPAHYTATGQGPNG